MRDFQNKIWLQSPPRDNGYPVADVVVSLKPWNGIDRPYEPYIQEALVDELIDLIGDTAGHLIEDSDLVALNAEQWQKIRMAWLGIKEPRIKSQDTGEPG